jgi:hypothetical protein
MRQTRGKSALPFVKIAGNPCAASLFSIPKNIGDALRGRSLSRRRASESARADSESRFLATKIFSG